MGVKKIMVVDDEEDFCHFVKQNLEVEGEYQVAACNESTRAVEQVQQFKPDLILLDILMPGLSGSEIAKQLKSRQETQTIPLLFLTALSLEKESDEYVLKPVSMNDLRDRIEQVLSRKGAADRP